MEDFLLERIQKLETEVAELRRSLVFLAIADLNASKVATERIEGKSEDSSYEGMVNAHQRMFKLLNIGADQDTDE